ncbi:isochorismatase family protein [Lentzea sp. PSKA42]|uniref:Isochorismatase family protein n=1 Tax=Lentzea indica TaxID=2604800 RepID=A0ABX1FFK7_9PSEU|nr:isochorismatase family protein [Lentzea indica]
MVIVDVQEVLIPVVWRGTELADRIAVLATKARDRGVPVVALQQVGGEMFDPAKPGTRLAGRLRLQPSDTVIQKTATDGFYRSDLEAFLRSQNVDTIVLTGVATDYCVDATARSAVSHGFDVVLVEDGHAPVRHGDEEAGLSAEQIIARHNRLLRTAVHPGGTIQLRPATQVFD